MGDTISSLGLCCALYQKCGFVNVGVVPDANGLGKLDILMAKRIYIRRLEIRGGASEPPISNLQL